MASEISKPLTDDEKEEKNKWEKWDVESAVRTLKEAELIKTRPNLMKLVTKQAKKEIRSLEDLRQAVQNYRPETNDNEDTDPEQ